MSPNRFGSLFSPVVQLVFCWKLPQIHLHFMQFLPFLCWCIYGLCPIIWCLPLLCNCSFFLAIFLCDSLSPLSLSLSSALPLHPLIHPGALQIEMSEESDQGKYECVATNSDGTRYSTPANLYVRGKRGIKNCLLVQLEHEDLRIASIMDVLSTVVECN